MTTMPCQAQGLRCGAGVRCGGDQHRRPHRARARRVRGARAGARLGRPAPGARQPARAGQQRSTRSGSRSGSRALAKRSIKKESKLWALDLAIRMIDLTTLEGKDTPGKIRALCAEGDAPAAGRPDDPVGRRRLRLPGARRRGARRPSRGSSVKVASVATGFPSRPDVPRHQARRDPRGRRGRRRRDRHGHRPRRVPVGRLRDGLRGDRRRSRRPAATAHLKVILETGELETYDNVRRASVLAMAAGADFIKTSTGKVDAGRDAAGDARDARGDPRLRAARPGGPVGHEAGRRHPDRQGGDPVPRRPVRDARAALDDARTGSASARQSLLNDVLMQIRKERDGRYPGADYFTLD